MLPNLKQEQKRTKELVKTITFELNPADQQLGLGKKYYVKTYGCQMNEHDSENLKALLELMGFKESSTMKQADLVLLNTCAIRENAHHKVFGMLGRLKHQKETKPHLIVGLCGCMAQEESVINEIATKYKWLDFVFGTHNLYDLPAVLASSFSNPKTEIAVQSIEGDIVEAIPVKRANKYKAWINIMYGCDKFCTYCIVPYTRGKQRSRHMEAILNEVIRLKEDGYQEITLLGQNVNAYGKDLGLGYDMSDLLIAVAKTGIKRIRFVTSHPWDFNDKMISAMASYPNIMPYIHLPVQSGSDRILKLMGRRYTKESYLTLVDNLKTQIPRLAITTDIIVGFPGETEADFNETLELVKSVGYDGAYTFIYSKRVGTPAASMPDPVSLETKKERLQRLNELVNYYARLHNEAYLNQIVPVLIEGYSEKNHQLMMGYTDTMKLVNVKTSKQDIGKIINVKITDIKTWSMDGIKADC